MEQVLQHHALHARVRRARAAARRPRRPCPRWSWAAAPPASSRGRGREPRHPRSRSARSMQLGLVLAGEPAGHQRQRDRRASLPRSQAASSCARIAAHSSAVLLTVLYSSRVARGERDAARAAAPADDQVRPRPLHGLGPRVEVADAVVAPSKRTARRPTGRQTGAAPRASACARRAAGTGSRSARARSRASPCRGPAPRGRPRRGLRWRRPWPARTGGGTWRGRRACRSRSVEVIAPSAVIVAQASSEPRSPRPKTDR